MPQKQRSAATCISEHLINIYILGHLINISTRWNSAHIQSNLINHERRNPKVLSWVTRFQMYQTTCTLSCTIFFRAF